MLWEATYAVEPDAIVVEDAFVRRLAELEARARRRPPRDRAQSPRFGVAAATLRRVWPALYVQPTNGKTSLALAQSIVLHEEYRINAHGQDSLMRGRRVVVPGLGNKLVTFMPRLLPRGLILRLVLASQAGRGSRDAPPARTIAVRRSLTALAIAIAIAAAATQTSFAASRQRAPAGSCRAANGASSPDGTTVAFNPCPDRRCAAALDIYLTCRAGRWFYRNGTPYTSITGEPPTPSR
jgi:hypothetical protein